MIDWQLVAMSLAGMLSSWAIWEVKRLNKAIHDLRNALQPVVGDVAYLKGYLAGKKEAQNAE